MLRGAIRLLLCCIGRLIGMLLNLPRIVAKLVALLIHSDRGLIQIVLIERIHNLVLLIGRG